MATTFDRLTPIKISSITVKELLASPLNMKILNDATGEMNEIINKKLNRPQFVLTGYKVFQNYKSIQIMGNTEYFYTQSLLPERRLEIYNYMMSYHIPCFIFTDQITPDNDFLEIAKKNGIAVISTNYDSVKLQMLLSEFLDDKFAVHTSVHGTFVDVCGVGMLFAGESGIGKSEIALDLVERGHRLVADDAIMLTQKFESILMGTGTTINRHNMEIRGLGIINVREMFGIRSIRFQKRLELIVELVAWNKELHQDRTGLEERKIDILGIKIPSIMLPIYPGKNITVIAESIAINYLLKTYGINSAQEFSEHLKSEIAKQKQIFDLRGKTPADHYILDKRLVSWFQFDRE